MQFNSYIFILLYFPILIIGYFALNRINKLFGKIFLTIGGLVFYAYGGWDITIILLASIAWNYLFSVVLSRMETKTIKSKCILAGSIVGNVLLLLYYKYFNFMIVNMNSVLHRDFPLKKIILPLGISFFTFQQIMYVVNVYRKNIETADLLDYLAYILYFPKLIMGPINDPVQFIGQINDESLKKVNWDNIAYGLKIFSFGLFKKLVLADTFAKAVNWGFGNFDAATSMDWFLVMLFYTFEIYFDFSGYSDMAIGVSTMLNIELPMNFDSPYKAVSIRDFWKRWHMSLTGFLTKYVYFSLGGSKKGVVRTYINTMIVFLVSGIWHGANWTFILWGIFHGLFSVLERVFDKYMSKLSEVVRWMYTFFVVNVLWLLFRADSITQWKTILYRIFTFQNTSISSGLLECFVLPETNFFLINLHLYNLNSVVRGFSLVIFTFVAFVVCLIPQNNVRKLKEITWINLIMAILAFTWAFLCLSSESVFVYFNF